MSRKKKNDTSSIDVKELGSQVESLAPALQQTLELKAVELSQRILQLENTIKGKDQEIAHLRDMLDKMVPQIDSFEAAPVMPTSEEIIALKQLDLIQQDANSRRLTLEEVKIFDILVKNKRLAQGKATDTVDMVKLPKEKAQLIKIASRPVKDGEEN